MAWKSVEAAANLQEAFRILVRLPKKIETLVKEQNHL